MLKKASFILLILVLVAPIYSESITTKNFGENPPLGASYSTSDKIFLNLKLTSSCEFGITTSSYAGSAEHTGEIILDQVEEKSQITSKLNKKNEAVYVYYRAFGATPFGLYLSLEGDMKGTVGENTATIPWEIVWTDDNNVEHSLTSNYEGDDGGNSNSINRRILTYNKPDDALGKNDIRKISSISIIPFSEGSKEPDVYQGTIRVTLISG